MESDMKTVYTMPKWAIDLVTMAKGQHDTSESRLLALDVLDNFKQDCPDGLADEIVYHSLIIASFEESLVFGKEEREGFHSCSIQWERSLSI
jgi:hypothetical protein